MGYNPPDGPLVQGAGGPIGSATNFEASTPARVEPTEGAVCRPPPIRVISLPRSKQVAFEEEQTSNGSRNPQSRSK